MSSLTVQTGSAGVGLGFDQTINVLVTCAQDTNLANIATAGQLTVTLIPIVNDVAQPMMNITTATPPDFSNEGADATMTLTFTKGGSNAYSFTSGTDGLAITAGPTFFTLALTANCRMSGAVHYQTNSIEDITSEFLVMAEPTSAQVGSVAAFQTLEDSVSVTLPTPSFPQSLSVKQAIVQLTHLPSGDNESVTLTYNSVGNAAGSWTVAGSSSVGWSVTNNVATLTPVANFTAHTTIHVYCTMYIYPIVLYSGMNTNTGVASGAAVTVPTSNSGVLSGALVDLVPAPAFVTEANGVTDAAVANSNSTLTVASEVARGNANAAAMAAAKVKYIAYASGGADAAAADAVIKAKIEADFPIYVGQNIMSGYMRSGPLPANEVSGARLGRVDDSDAANTSIPLSNAALYAALGTVSYGAVRVAVVACAEQAASFNVNGVTQYAILAPVCAGDANSSAVYTTMNIFNTAGSAAAFNALTVTVASENVGAGFGISTSLSSTAALATALTAGNVTMGNITLSSNGATFLVGLNANPAAAVAATVVTDAVAVVSAASANIENNNDFVTIPNLSLAATFTPVAVGGVPSGSNQTFAQSNTVYNLGQRIYANMPVLAAKASCVDSNGNGYILYQVGTGAFAAQYSPDLETDVCSLVFEQTGGVAQTKLSAANVIGVNATDAIALLTAANGNLVLPAFPFTFKTYIDAGTNNTLSYLVAKVQLGGQALNDNVEYSCQAHLKLAVAANSATILNGSQDLSDGYKTEGKLTRVAIGALPTPTTIYSSEHLDVGANGVKLQMAGVTGADVSVVLGGTEFALLDGEVAAFPTDAAGFASGSARWGAGQQDSKLILDVHGGADPFPMDGTPVTVWARRLLVVDGAVLTAPGAGEVNYYASSTLQFPVSHDGRSFWNAGNLITNVAGGPLQPVDGVFTITMAGGLSASPYATAVGGEKILVGCYHTGPNFPGGAQTFANATDANGVSIAANNTSDAVPVSNVMAAKCVSSTVLSLVGNVLSDTTVTLNAPSSSSAYSILAFRYIPSANYDLDQWTPNFLPSASAKDGTPSPYNTRFTRSLNAMIEGGSSYDVETAMNLISTASHMSVGQLLADSTNTTVPGASGIAANTDFTVGWTAKGGQAVTVVLIAAFDAYKQQGVATEGGGAGSSLDGAYAVFNYTGGQWVAAAGSANEVVTLAAAQGANPGFDKAHLTLTSTRVVEGFAAVVVGVHGEMVVVSASL